MKFKLNISQILKKVQFSPKITQNSCLIKLHLITISIIHIIFPSFSDIHVGQYSFPFPLFFYCNQHIWCVNSILNICLICMNVYLIRIFVYLFTATTRNNQESRKCKIKRNVITSGNKRETECRIGTYQSFFLCITTFNLMLAFQIALYKSLNDFL